MYHHHRNLTMTNMSSIGNMVAVVVVVMMMMMMSRVSWISSRSG